MKNCTLLVFALLLFSSGALLAQDETQPASTDDLDLKEAKRYTPPCLWELSPNFGYLFVAGDVDPQFGWAAGLSVRKATDYIFSLRGDLLYGQAKGDNGDGSRDFEMNWFSGTFLGVFSLNSLQFDKPVRNVNIYAMGGGGFNFFSVPNYTNIPEGERNQEIESEIAPHVTLGAGISFRFSPSFNLGVEYQASTLFGQRTDLLDGIEEGGNFRDILNYINLRLNFNIGNKQTRTEPLYWINPLGVVLEDMNQLENAQQNLVLEDSDGDGVIDQIDAEPNTAPGALVDTKGRTLDSDRDGVPDHLDKEPYYTPRAGERVNSDGVVINPMNTGGGVTEERVRELIDEALQDFQPATSGGGLTDLFLPMIHFAINSKTIKYSDYGTLASIARVMKDNPNVRLVIKGYTDQTGSETYNEVLSYERALAVIDHLVNNHGIGRGRLLLQFGGQDEALVPTTSSYMNRRVEFSVAKSDDVEMDPPANYNQNKSGGY